MKLDIATQKVVNYGIIFSSFILLASILTLIYYNFFYLHPLVYNIGILLFQAGTTYFFCFLFGGFAFNKIKEDLK